MLAKGCVWWGFGVGGGEGQGWVGWVGAFFLASLSSLEVECLSPPPPLFEPLAFGQVTNTG